MISVRNTMFCVYRHEIDGAVFYVGKGSLSRAFMVTNRNSLYIREQARKRARDFQGQVRLMLREAVAKGLGQ